MKFYISDLVPLVDPDIVKMLHLYTEKDSKLLKITAWTEQHRERHADSFEIQSVSDDRLTKSSVIDPSLPLRFER